ncbi:hypothetical protein [Rhizobium sp. R339]|uniref:hypothetical protein n=1 Tax=Rhizobium sp. R339 TaxID=1764273 RepID=UPI001FDA6482|nr:hypothetical protein [Rhizobium sp. R339]
MSDLLDVQRRLQAEADEGVRALRLDELLGDLGQAIRVGSSAMGLMVRRDIDITVVCPAIDPVAFEAFTAIGARLMRMTERVVAVRFRNDSGRWNREPEKYPDGFTSGCPCKCRIRRCGLSTSGWSISPTGSPTLRI